MFLILGQKVKGQDHEVNISYIRQMCSSSYRAARQTLHLVIMVISGDNDEL